MKENISEILQRQYRGAILNFGPPFTGKTTSLSTLIPLGLVPIWVFDFDRKLHPLVRRIHELRLKGVPVADDDLVRLSYLPKSGDKIGGSPFRPRGQGQDTYLKFMDDFNILYDYVGPDGEWKTPGPAKWKLPKVIVFDGLTGLQDMLLDFVLAMSGHELNAKGTDARADYGQQMGKIVEIVSSAKGLPLLSIFNAHEKPIYSQAHKEDAAVSELRIDPLVTGILSASIGKEFLACVYSTTEGPQASPRYVWKLQSDGKIKGVGTTFSEGGAATIPQDYGKLLVRLEDKS